MSKYITQILVLLLITLAGLAGSVIVGVLAHGTSVFDARSITFIFFVIFGLSGSFIFAFYHVRGLTETITAAVVVSAIQFGISTTSIPVVNAAIWSFGVNVPIIMVAFLFERKLAPFRQFKFLIVAALYGAMFVLLNLLNAWVTGVETLPAAAFRENFVDGLLLGLGIGLGIEVGEAFVHSFELRARS